MTQFINYASPLDQFEVTSLAALRLSFFNTTLQLTITNVAFYVLVTLALVLALHVLSSNGQRLVPSRRTVGLETVYDSVHTIVKEQIGTENERYLPFLYSLFLLILISNLIGNVPYSYAFLTSAAGAIGLSLTIFLGVTILGLSKHGLHFFSYFVPSGTPLALVPLLSLIELISYSARALSLGVRLFANLVAGHTLLKILSGMLRTLFTSGIIVGLVTLIPRLIFLGLVGLELAVSFIQAYVFTVLTAVYLKDSIDLH